jgi:acyl-CoA thioester hydrolase
MLPMIAPRHEGQSHQHTLRVRYGETDQMGVVHHANYLLYVEESRTGLMAARGYSYAELERCGWALPVRKCELRFRTPAHYEDDLVVETRVTKLGAASVVFASEIRRPKDQAWIASVTVELACVRKAPSGLELCPLPEDLRTGLSA